MPAERYFIDADLRPHQHQELAGSEFHHLAHVMRTRKGDSIEIVNGRGALAQAIVHDLAKDKVWLQIEEVYQEPPSSNRLILAQALSKQNRLDVILEKGTELGVDCFWLFPGHHSAKKECYPSQLERAYAMTIAAMKQCGRLYLPSIIIKPAIDEWNELAQSSAFFGDLDPIAPLFEVAWKKLNPPSYPAIFITGPEGGFSQQETNLLKKQGAIGVKLHANILRTETASILALSLLSHWMLSSPTNK
jgi:16S rRNA (uracil1498-N3)-methyltransferase